MYSFFDEYDLSGKTIVPFNSHNGSRFSGTIETIQKLEPDAAEILFFSCICKKIWGERKKIKLEKGKKDSTEHKG